MEKIGDLLANLEAKRNIRIIYAVEAGSREWRLDSADSDYDIRFIYIRRSMRSYVSLREHKETIEGFSEPDRLYDWQGYDISKALCLAAKLNPSVCEWLYSDTVYKLDGELAHVLNSVRRLLAKQRRISPLLYHYRSMAKSNYHAHVASKIKTSNGMSDISPKKYLYVVRPAAMVQWLLLKREGKVKSVKLVETNFLQVVEDLRGAEGGGVSAELCDAMLQLVERKKRGDVKQDEKDEKEEEASVVRMRACLEQWLDIIINKSDFESIKANEQAQSDTDADVDGSRLPTKLLSLDDELDRLYHAMLKIRFDADDDDDKCHTPHEQSDTPTP